MAEAIPALLAAGGSILKGIGGLQAGNANKRALDAQAREELIAGNAQALRVRDQARQQIGNQLGAQYASGFVGGGGSALDAINQSQINETLDMLQLQREAQTKAIAAQQQGLMAQHQGRLGLAEGLIGAGSDVYKMTSDWGAATAGQTLAAPAAPDPGEITVTRGQAVGY
jgi:hypothetical protein